MLILIIILSWLSCTVATVGMGNADAYGDYPLAYDYRKDVAFHLMLGLFFGPLAMMIVYFMSGFARHGFSLKNLRTINS